MTQTKTNRTSSFLAKPNLFLQIRANLNGSHTYKAKYNGKELGFGTCQNREDAESELLALLEEINMDEEALQSIEMFLDSHWNESQALGLSGSTTKSLFFRPLND